jgi:hypothetical protein
MRKPNPEGGSMTYWTGMIILGVGAMYAGWILKLLWQVKPSEDSLRSRPSQQPALTRLAPIDDLSPKLISVLQFSHGGVHKRISEIREITQSIRMRHPDLFKHEAGLASWLSASDAFLCQLRDVTWPEGSSPEHDELRRRFDSYQARPDYETLA